jgi:hypothetical protein
MGMILGVVAVALATAGVLALGAGNNANLLLEQARKHKPRAVCISDPAKARELQNALGSQAQVFSGSEGLLKLATLPEADVVLIAIVGTAVEVTPIRSVDQITVGEGRRGPITTAIQKAFFDYVAGRTPDRHHWLTPVAVAPTKAKAATVAYEAPSVI